MECQGGEESPQPAKTLMEGSWSFPSTGTTDRSPKSPTAAEGPESAHPQVAPPGSAEARSSQRHCSFFAGLSGHSLPGFLPAQVLMVPVGASRGLGHYHHEKKGFRL